LRRYYECVFVEKPSLTARMHVGHYIVGVSYYIVTCTATWCYFSMNPSTSIGLRHLLSVCLFTYASLHQYRCHSILAQLRSTSSASNSSSYSIPYGDWFHWVSSPHYFAELLIYVALSAILHFPLVWCCLLVWVVINLGTTAHMTHEWYRRHFNCYPIERAAFIP
ncbi:3-oxo-5-alpha-steroid 4-dehydrogenase, partial [Syncephalis fuscata]